jgi:hypothetical protein
VFSSPAVEALKDGWRCFEAGISDAAASRLDVVAVGVEDVRGVVTGGVAAAAGGTIRPEACAQPEQEVVTHVSRVVREALDRPRSSLPALRWSREAACPERTTRRRPPTRARFRAVELELGIAVDLRDVETLDDLDDLTAPAPVEPGDLLASSSELYRVEAILVLAGRRSLRPGPRSSRPASRRLADGPGF